VRVAIKFAYDGRRFYGYARQPGLRTVEGEIIKKLVEKGIIKSPKESYFRSASRTDKGVSALGNVIAFNTQYEEDILLDEEDILFYGIKRVDYRFYPRHAKKRIYRYYLENDLDLDKILSAAELFTGKHDFTNFARIENSNPIKTIDNIIITPYKNFLVIDFHAKNFVWNQVRRIVSALKKVGEGIIKEEEIKKALNRPEERVDFGVADAEPLILKDVLYDFEFDYYENRRRLSEFEKRLIFS
jgi:tRNA pseudouridine38-40 synthase